MYDVLSASVKISFLTCCYLFSINAKSLAQVTSDGTVNTQVNQNGNSAEITGGEIRGRNLFHSFQDFSVPTGNEAFFDNSPNISNILSRVTGGNISNIDGAIRANGSANLFLINPAGIIFGENARLDIGGSFYGSTASSILFEDGEFSAADIENPPLLTVNAPIGLGFRDNPGQIINNSVTNNGNGLAVTPGNNISLLGGDVTSDGGQIVAPGANIELGGLAEAGTISISDDTSIFPENVRRGNVAISNNSRIVVVGGGEGSINVNANNFDLLSGSVFVAGINAGLGTPETQAGNVTINAQESLNLNAQGSSGITAILNNNAGTGNLGNVTLSARNITFSNGGNILNANSNQGNIGNVNLVATEDIIFDGSQFPLTNAFSGIQNAIFENAGGSIASTNITAQNLSVINGATILSLVEGTADSADINLNIADTIDITGTADASSANGSITRFPSNITTAVLANGTGNSGDINLNTQNLALTNNGEIDASTVGEGNAGNINITASTIDIDGEGENVAFLDPANISSLAASDFTNKPDATANGGNITIETDSLSIRNGGIISADNLIAGNGDGGNITIDATNTVSVDGTGFSRARETEFPSVITADIGANAVGNAGNIEINTAQLAVTNDAEISTDVTTGGSGNGGSIIINATDLAVLSGGDISTDLSFDTTGQGGDLSIETARLTVSDSSQISAATLGDGDAGNLTITATESIDLDGRVEQFRSGLLTNAISGSGKGGNINVITDKLTISNGATITASNFPSSENADEQPGTGEPGNINVEATSISLENEGRIEAATQSSTGEGANINLQVTEDLTLQDNSLVSARAFDRGNGGNLNIDSRFIVAFPNENNDIIADAQQGNGGKIDINTESLFGIEERSLNSSTNDINASSQFSLDGTVNISTPDINPVQGATELPANVVEPEATTQQACEANRASAAKNSLTITGRGSISPEPGLPLDSLNVIVKEQTNPTSITPVPIETSQGEIQPARGIEVTKSGEVILTAYKTNNAGNRLPKIKRNCSRVSVSRLANQKTPL